MEGGRVLVILRRFRNNTGHTHPDPTLPVAVVPFFRSFIFFLSVVRSFFISLVFSAALLREKRTPREKTVHGRLPWPHPRIMYVSRIIDNLDY